MQPEGFRVTAAHEERHWWFRARRDLFLRQVERAVRDAAAPPGRRLRILDARGLHPAFSVAYIRPVTASRSLFPPFRR